MAGFVYELMAKLGLDTKEYDEGLKGAGEEGRAAGSKIGGALKTAAKLGGLAIAGATTAAVSFGKSAVEAGLSFDSSMSQVAATMGFTVDQLNEDGSEAAATFNTLSAFAQQMGSTTAFSASEAADALNYMALAGYDAETSMKMLPNVLNLAAAGGIELAQASDMVTDAQSALGLTLDETAAMVDQMAKASSKSNTSVQQLGEAFLTIGATARSIKGGTTELSTVLGVLADNGIKGAEGGTHLRNMIMSLQNPTSDGAKALEQLGISVYDADGNMKSLVSIIGQMQSGMQDMDAASRDAMINGIFNKADAAAVNALLGTELSRFSELTFAIKGADGAAKAMAETQLDNLSGDVTKFKSALEGAQLAISSGVTPDLRELVQFGTSGISKLTDAFSTGGFEGAMSALGGIISDGIAMITERLPEVVNAGMGLLSALVTGIIHNLPALASAAVEIIGSLANSLVEDLPELIPAVVDMVLTIVDTLTDPANLENLINAALQIIIALATGLIQALPELIAKGPEIIKNLVEALIAETPQILAAALHLIVALATGLVTSLPELVVMIPEIITAIVGGLIAGVKDIIAVGGDLVKGLWQGISDSVTWMWQQITGFVNGLIDRFKNLLGIHSPSTVFAGFGQNIVQGIVNGIGDMWNSLKTKIADVASSVKEGFMEKVNAAATWGSDLAQNFASGITQKINAVKDSVKAAADKVKSFLGFSEPDEGPLSDFHTYAPDMMRLFAQGIKDNTHLITDQIGTSFDFSDKVANASVHVNGGSTGSIDIVSALQTALSGMGVYIDGRKVGTLVTDYQLGNARAMGY